ncbi:helix-turn-helix transcriptional regulator [Chloroflexales bacterium ZM16-3]|nr:helix-turn-helix transcriptional regulator [Chloroflexales bacterium ZM16-3]
MGKIKYKARMLRVELQQKEGQNVTIQEVSEAVGVDRFRLSRIEMGHIKAIKPEELVAICTFYTARLERFIDTNDVLGFDPNDQRALELASLAA